MTSSSRARGERATCSSAAPSGDVDLLREMIGFAAERLMELEAEASIRRLVGAILMEQTEEWTVQRGRYLTLETLAPVCDDVMVSLPAAQRD